MKHFYVLFSLITSLSFAQLTPPAAQQNYYQNIDFSQSGMPLFNNLATETAVKHTNYLSYTPGIWEASKITDQDPANPNNVLLIYGFNDVDNNYITDRTRSNTRSGGNTGTDWNREHTFPNSLANPKLSSTGRNVPPYADAHNLRPSDVKMNSNRGNLKYITNIKNGVTLTNTAKKLEGSWYPGDEWKGDAARIIMYMYLRYGTQCKPSYVAVGEKNVVDPNMINLLLEWNAQDPVSIIEDQRNTYHSDATNAYGQGNRNPFIDNPYLATIIWGGAPATNRWGDDQPSDMEAPTSPTYLTATNSTSTTVDLNWEPSTDNTGVTAYQIHVDDAFFVSTNGSTTSLTVTDLAPETTYQFSVLASDFANNKSTLSNTTAATTLESTVSLEDNCVLETFDNLTSTEGINDNQYGDRTWTDTNGLNWKATGARIDQTVNNSKAIIIRQGTITAPTFSNGIGQLTLTTQRVFSGGSGTFDLSVNGLTIEQLPYTDILETITIENINIAGDIDVVLNNFSSSRDRVIIENLSWTCYKEAAAAPCTTETFSNLESSSDRDSQYTNRTWTGDNALVWNATGARIDQTVNNSKVIAIRNGALTAPATPYGISDLTVTTQRIFSGGSGTFDVVVNNTVVGKIPYSDEVQTTTIPNINMLGDVTVILNNPSSTSDRVIFEDLSWTCLQTTLNQESFYLKELKIYPNPIRGNYFKVSTNTNLNFEIYNLLGESVQKGHISSTNQTINTSRIESGVYLLQLSSEFKTITKKIIKQ